MNKRFNRLFTSKLFIGVIIVLSQVLFVITTFILLSRQFMVWRIILILLNVFSTLHIINRESDNTFKIGWITLILIQPFIGTILYLMMGNYRIPKKLQNLAKKEKSEKNEYYYDEDEAILEEIKNLDKTVYRNFNYLSNTAGFPVYKNTYTNYLRSGEEKYATMIKELEKAKEFILLEYFIIDQGVLWSYILEILKRKIKEGVEVFVMYDDIGCLNTLPVNYDEYLRSLGIKCHVFNPIRLTSAISMNYRNHRKLCIIDGKVAITGGINLADEYINRKKRFGYWRDSSVIIKGAAVWNFTLVYLRFFSYLSNEKIDYFKYKKDIETFTETYDGYAIPYSDSPTDDNEVGHSVHMNLITSAKDYLYIQSPYVILDQGMRNALILAAQKGVDVRLMIPHIPDKKYVFYMTKENCRILMKYGIRVYEYMPGFVHSKTFVSDDENAVVGTVNLDYRSHYLHYECGVLFYQTPVIQQLKDDFLQTLKQCNEVSYDEYTNVSLSEKIIRVILNIFTPIL